MGVGYDHDEGNGSDVACDRHDVVSDYYGVGCDHETGCSDRGREDRNRLGERRGRNEGTSDPHVHGHDSDVRCSDGFLHGGFHLGENDAVSESGAGRDSGNALNACNHAFLHVACELPRMPSLLESKHNGVSLRVSTWNSCRAKHLLNLGLFRLKQLLGNTIGAFLSTQKKIPHLPAECRSVLVEEAGKTMLDLLDFGL